ncbi:hypothetical protein A6U98_27260 [Rhizobium sp. WYCCWR10014]|nr:hypothetical protein A6U98_27260 [Rhizobium sp. WYCCWR10014]
MISAPLTLPYYRDKATHYKRHDQSAHIGTEPSETSMNGVGGGSFEQDFESLFQSSHKNIGQFIALVFQEQRAHGLVLTLKETLDLIRHIIVLFFTGSSRPWEEAR